METSPPAPDPDTDPATADVLDDPRHTWRIPDDRRLPAIDPYSDAVHRTPPVTVRETLWDTDDRVLAFEGVELLRAEDGSPTWSIDRGDGPAPVPDDLDRATAPSDDGQVVPRDVVEVFLRGRTVRPVRVRDTTTTLVVVRGKDGKVRVEVADVRIDEGDSDSTLVTSGRWWALTDDGHPGSIARAVERALTDAADDPGRSDRGPVPRLAPARRPATARAHLPRPGTAAAFVRETLVGLRADLVAIDPLVRADERDAVHAFRKVLRRTRSVLAAFRGALDRDATEPLRAALAQIGRTAGTARDAEVLRDRLLRSAARTPAGYVDARTLDRLGSRFEDTRATSGAELRQTLRTAAWFDALDAVDRLVDSAPTGGHARDDASAFVTARIERERARLAKTLDRSTGDLVSLHEIRKAARRLRYALQAAGGLADVGKRRLGRLRRIQDTLGDALDAAHAADAYRQAAVDAAADGEDTFGYGALATSERAVVEQRIAEGRRLLAGL